MPNSMAFVFDSKLTSSPRKNPPVKTLRLAPNRPTYDRPSTTNSTMSRPMSNFSQQLHESKLNFFAEKLHPQAGSDRIKLAEEYRREYSKLL